MEEVRQLSLHWDCYGALGASSRADPATHAGFWSCRGAGCGWHSNQTQTPKRWDVEQSVSPPFSRPFVRLSLAVCLPACGYLFYYNFVAHPMHEEQRQFVAYPHLRIRTKRFPWTESDLTLFHNPHTNPGPDSGEHEEEHGASAPFLTRLFASGMDTAEQTREKREAHLRYIQAKSQA